MTCPNKNAFRRSALSGIVAGVLSVGTVVAQAGIPVPNWTVPPYHRSSAAGGLTTMTDVTPGVAFVGMSPCRVVDTRPSQGFGAGYGPPILAANTIRPFDINSGPCPGIPEGVGAYSLNFTVTDTAGAPGDIRVFPTGTPIVGTSVLNWNFVGTGAIANAFIIPAGTGGSIDVQVAGFDTHLIIDINGYFTASYNPGVQLSATGSIAATGMITGVNAHNADGSAGVKGVQGSAVPSAPNQIPAGVVGTSSLFDGVLGLTIAGSGGAGVKGLRSSGAAGVLSSGELGVANLGGRFFNGVEINGNLDVLMDDTFGDGNISADGTLTLGGSKSFIEPHPTDPSKAIRYICLEGPESGTYFRGRGKFQRGIARIPVPEDFRLVTDAEGLTVQITPIGGMASVGVLTMNLNEIVAQSSRNVEFSYLVQGVRRAFRNHQPVEEAGIRYVRRGTESRIGSSLPAEHRRRLIENGTYNPDGTVNMETARRLGWDRIWADRKEPVTAPSE